MTTRPLLEDREAPRIRLPRIERKNVEDGVWPEWLCTAKLAEYLGVHRTTISYWHNNHELPAPSIVHGKKNGRGTVKMAARKYWSRIEIDTWMAGKRQRRARRLGT